MQEQLATPDKARAVNSAFSLNSDGGGTTKASAAALDVEVFGGVVTNIEKLLTLNQRKKLRKQ